MLKKIRTFIACSGRKKFLFFAACTTGYYAWFVEKFFADKFTFGRELRKPLEAELSVNNTSQVVMDIMWAIKIAHNYLCVENVCRHQSFQAKVLCRLFKLPYRTYIGVKRGAHGKTEAHAWTVVKGTLISGFCVPEEYSILTVYANEH